MADQDQPVTGDWVEIAEQSSPERLVFLRSGSADIPPARGRRMLQLRDQGQALTEAPGPTDKPETTGSGGWILDGTILYIRVPGWEGEYDIEDVQGNQLILRRR